MAVAVAVVAVHAPASTPEGNKVKVKFVFPLLNKSGSQDNGNLRYYL